ncbi:MAG: histidine kinase [Taibaiella sp.]|nr:histidine kinase [Taibaiella sp.]
MKQPFLKILLHIIIWAVFLSLPTLFMPRFQHGGDLHHMAERHDHYDDHTAPGGTDHGIPHQHHWHQRSMPEDLVSPSRLANGAVLIAVFYFNYLIVIPMFYMRRRYGWVTVLSLICLTVLVLVNMVTMPKMGHHTPSGLSMLGPSHNIFMFLIVFIASYAIFLYNQWQMITKEKLNTEISFLKAQINPHFLFNTLNSIYSLTLTKSDKAPDAVVKLSGMMRYTISDAHESYVPLEKEITYIRNYIELQKLRLAEKVRITFDTDGDMDTSNIAPFILIPFIENAFKFGVNPEEDSEIVITIHTKAGNLELRVFNKKVYVQHKEEGTGLGIENTRRRLNLLYPGRHALSIRDTDEDFTVLLIIDLV